MAANRGNMIKSCQRSGFVGAGNSQVPLNPTTLSESSYYSPVRYPGTLNAHATSLEDCEYDVKTFLITFGVLVFLVEILQVNTIAWDDIKFVDAIFFFFKIALLCIRRDELCVSSA